MKKFGLIGKNISYSFSKSFFENKFQKLMLHHVSYEIFDLENISAIENLFEKEEQLAGFNVTIPYKVEIIPYLDELSEEASKIGAVNTVLIKNGKKIGYNTDAFGFEKSLLLMKKDHHQSALILGNGGAAKAVQFVLEKHQIPYKSVYRKGELNFENLTHEIVAQHQLIIQTTPVGTFPKTADCLVFPFDALTEKHLVIDLIYNPNYTQFIQNAAQKNAKTMNGFFMLEQQAEKSWEIWSY